MEKGRLDTSDKGFGLANVNERIRLNYGRAYGLIIESTYEQGTSVTVRLPREIMNS